MSRTLLKQGGAALAGWALLNTLRVGAAPVVLAQSGVEVLPWLDQPAENPVPDVVTNMLDWEELDSWITPPENFFSVAHYGSPEVDVNDWQLEIAGLVDNPMTLTMADLQAWPRQELDFTIECSGNHGFDWNWGLLGNASWAGVALLPLLHEAGIKDDAIEVAFYGVDAGEETVREQTITQHFARSMSIEDAMQPLQPALLRNERRPAACAPRLPAAADCTRLVWHCQCQVAPAHRSAQPALDESLYGARLCDVAQRSR